MCVTRTPAALALTSVLVSPSPSPSPSPTPSIPASLMRWSFWISVTLRCGMQWGGIRWGGVGGSISVCVRAVSVCVRVYVRACACVYARPSMRVCGCMCVCACVCACVHMCSPACGSMRGLCTIADVHGIPPAIFSRDRSLRGNRSNSLRMPPPLLEAECSACELLHCACGRTKQR